MYNLEIFIYDQAVGLDIMGPLEVFAAANVIYQQQGKDEPAYHVVLSADKAGLITLSSGVQIQATRSLGRGAGSDYFMLVGGFDFESLCGDRRLLDRLRKRAARSRRLVSICTGAFLLAAAGLLEGKACTTHWGFSQRLAREYPSINVHPDAIYIQDGDTYSSAGVTAGIDLALALVEQDYGVQLAMEVARSLVLYLRRPGGQSQFSSPLALRQSVGTSFSALHNWLLEDISRAVQVEQMADYCCMSPRHFARRFAEETGMTPAKYLEKLRLEHARELLESTSQTVESIALRTGFGREERLRRTFLKILGVSPSIYRQHFGVSV